MLMQLVERHVIKRTDVRFAAIDTAAFASKHLYNKALYATRQAFFQDGALPSYLALYHQMKAEAEYSALPRKVAQWVLKQVCTAWESYRQARAAYMADPSAFLGQPRIPHYLEKQGRNLLVYTTQALSQPGLRIGRIVPSGLAFEVLTKQTRIIQVRIVPKRTHYVVEVIYERPIAPASGDPTLIAAVDIGVNNLAALASNKRDFVPRLVNGRPLKSINQFYNKRKAELQTWIDNDHFTARMERMLDTRNRRMDHYLHTASRRIIRLLIAEGIGTLVIGKNPEWKQECSMRKREKQHFVQIPHARFVDMLTYKARLAGIQVVLTEESYTSQASFLDGDVIPTYGKVTGEPCFAGRRLKRGLYRASGNRYLNADVNGAYNILRKAVPCAFGTGIEDVVVHPRRLAA